MAVVSVRLLLIRSDGMGASVRIGRRPGKRSVGKLACLLAGLLVASFAFSFPVTAVSQPLQGMERPEPAPPVVPDRLTPQLVDGTLARLTDAEIRALLRAELNARITIDETEPREPVAAVNMRLAELATNIEDRLAAWVDEFGVLRSRLPHLAERVASARYGLGGMLAAVAAMVAAGVVSAGAVSTIARPWRTWLGATARTYWDKVFRTVALGLVEFAPIVAFVAATRVAHALLFDALGPLEAWIWIYHTGVSYALLARMLARRAFAPDAPAIRIAPVTDSVATSIFAVVARAVTLAAAGWLTAGLFPTLGLGFAPAQLTVAAFGSAVAALLVIAVLNNRQRICGVVTLAFAREKSRDGALGTVLVGAAPVVLLLYIGSAWLYWLLLWLENGQMRLAGPVGTLMVLLVAPIADRMGREVICSLFRGQRRRQTRVTDALARSWRLLVALAATLMILGLWGFDLLGLARGPDASPWAVAAFDIAVTLFLGSVVWRLIRAVLHTEARVAQGGEEADDPLEMSSSRLDTLTPIFRTMLLGLIIIVVAMIVLSALGVNIGPLIASAGIVGIAVGFGAQTLVRDIFSGIFFLVDDAFRIGEYIDIDGETRGEVEAISVRSLQLRHHRGAIITVPFGELKKVVNHSRDWVIEKLSFRLEPETDPQVVKRVVKTVARDLSADPEHGPKFIEPLKSQGVDAIDEDSALVIRVKFKSRPGAQFVLKREVYHRLRVAFADAGIRFARRKVEVVSRDGQITADANEHAAAVSIEPA